jgi:predicted restriction endonuclease
MSKAFEKIKESHTTSILESQSKLKKLYPYERLRGEGWAFFVNFETKQMVKITLGKQIFRTTIYPDKRGYHLVIADNQPILVPYQLIEDIGYN